MKKSTILLAGLFSVFSCYAQQPDMLEPNDKPEQAVAIDPFTTYLVSIFPNGDNDYFSFSLTKPMVVQPVAMGTAVSLTWDLLDEKGNWITNRFPYPALAGNYLLKLTGYSSPDQFMIMLKCTPQTNRIQQGKGAASIATNTAYPSSFNSYNQVDSISVSTKGGTGYITLQSIQAAENKVIFGYTLNGYEYRGNPLVIPVNNRSSINARLMPGSAWNGSEPFVLYASENSRMDEYEPNDSIGAAKSIDRDSRVFFSVFPVSDTDYFSVQLIEPGKIFASLFYAFTSGNNYNSFPYYVDLFDAKKNRVGAMGYRQTPKGYIYFSDYLKEKGTYYLKIYTTDQSVDEKMLGMRIYGNVSGGKQDDPYKDIYFVGFELDTSANTTLQALSSSVGSNFAAVDSTGSIEKTLNNVFEDSRGGRGSSWWWWIGGVVVAGAGYFVWRSRKKSK